MLEFIFIFASGFLSAVWMFLMFWQEKPRDPYAGIEQPDVRLTTIQSEHVRTIKHD